MWEGLEKLNSHRDVDDVWRTACKEMQGESRRDDKRACLGDCAWLTVRKIPALVQRLRAGWGDMGRTGGVTAQQ